MQTTAGRGTNQSSGAKQAPEPAGQSMLFPSIPPTIFRYHTPTCPALVVKRLCMFSRVRSLLYPSKREFYRSLPYIGLEKNSSAEKVEIRHRHKKNTAAGYLRRCFLRRMDDYARLFSKTRALFRPLITITSLGSTFPSRIWRESSFIRSRWMTRLMGRAPNCGSYP